MKHLKKFLTRLQTFEIRISQREVRREPPDEIKKVQAYDIRHETSQDEASTFESELRLLSELAALDLLSLDVLQLRLAHDLLRQVEERFKTFWVHYHNYCYDFWLEDHHYQDYLSIVGLAKLFLVRHPECLPSHALVDDTFVDDLDASVRFRSSLLTTLRMRVNSLLPAEQAQPTAPQAPLPRERVHSIPRFAKGISEQFYHILKDYFSPQDQLLLLPLLRENQPPAAPLVFHGNGNQLADAFKQLYEANLIVGCLKGELEEWLSRNFAYVFHKQQKLLPASYLAAIISSNAKPCQSPILDVRKQPDGSYSVHPVLRTQKNYNSQ